MPRATTTTTRASPDRSPRGRLCSGRKITRLSRLAQMVGYNNVAALARDAGIKSARERRRWRWALMAPRRSIWPEPIPPSPMAACRIDPWLVASVRSANGDVLNDYPANSKPILDPRVAYLTLALMENVINAGTGRQSSFRLASPRPPPARPAPRTMHGSPALPATCSAWCGSAMTTIRI